jgi:hypothetical protein
MDGWMHLHFPQIQPLQASLHYLAIERLALSLSLARVEQMKVIL